MNKLKKKILAISGSTRKNSSNETIINLIAKLSSADFDIQLYNQIDQLPHFNPDLENTFDVVNNFIKMIEKSDGVLICTPEYVFSLPGTLKNALDWTVATTVFLDKPLAFIVASASGEKAFESLDLIMNTFQAKMEDKSKLLIKGIRNKITTSGEVTDQKLLTDLKELILSLKTSIQSDNLSL